MPPDDKRPGRALGFSLPDSAGTGGASIWGQIQALEAEVHAMRCQLDAIHALVSHSDKKQRGRPRDAHADALNEIAEIGVVVLQEATESVRKMLSETLPADVPRNLLNIVNLALDRVERGFGYRLPVALKAAGRFHYEKQRGVKDANRAGRKARKRRKTKPPG